MSEANEKAPKASKTKMANPYDGMDDPGTVEVARRMGWTAVVIFLAICVIPPALRNINAARGNDRGWVPVVEIFRNQVAGKPAPPGDNRTEIVRHLAAFEDELEDAEFVTAARSWWQAINTKFLGEGNRKAVVGSEGHLFFQPAIDAFTGYGPLVPEPTSVASDPNAADWNGPIESITGFAAQLAERDIELLLVPVPVKPSIYPDRLGGSVDGTLRRADHDEIFAQLREGGVEVLDLTDSFWAMRQAGDEVFLKQDTHWTAKTMEASAAEVAAAVRAMPAFAECAEAAEAAGGFEYTYSEVERSHVGDNVIKLGLPDPEAVFPPEPQTLRLVTDVRTGEVVGRFRKDPETGISLDPTTDWSPVVLLGDSFVNIFDGPDLGFEDPDWVAADDKDVELPIGGGLGAHLTAQLGMPVDVIAKNGGGATEVRQRFLELGSNGIAQKRIVVWVIASRDLLYSKTPAQAAAVEWKPLDLPERIAQLPIPTPAPPLPPATVLAEVTAVSPVPDPSSVNYPDSLYAVKLRVVEVIDGSMEAEDTAAYVWAFREKKLLPTHDLQPGDRRVFDLVDLSTSSVKSAQVSDTLDWFGDTYYAREVTAP